jgi:uncharacterized membrane protein
MKGRRILAWFFSDRKTGKVTIAQAPNLVLWIVIAAAALRWLRSPADAYGTALTIIVRGGLLVWAVDEIFRGVNPWRRCLGTAVAAYEIATILI